MNYQDRIQRALEHTCKELRHEYQHTQGNGRLHNKLMKRLDYLIELEKTSFAVYQRVDEAGKIVWSSSEEVEA